MFTQLLIITNNVYMSHLSEHITGEVHKENSETEFSQMAAGSSQIVEDSELNAADSEDLELMNLLNSDDFSMSEFKGIVIVNCNCFQILEYLTS